MGPRVEEVLEAIQAVEERRHMGEEILAREEEILEEEEEVMAVGMEVLALVGLEGGVVVGQPWEVVLEEADLGVEEGEEEMDAVEVVGGAEDSVKGVVLEEGHLVVEE